MKYLGVTLSVVSVLILPQLSGAYIGGTYPEDSLPGVVSLNRGDYQCSGTVVSSQLVLTAAHCEAFLGRAVGERVTITDHRGHISPTTSTEQTILEFRVHPAWRNQGKANLSAIDLALLRVADVQQFGIAKINFSPLYSGTSVVVGGFGCKGQGFSDYPFITAAPKKIRSILSAVFTVGLQDDTQEKTLSSGCDGDSGGGAFAFNPKTHEFELVGVNQAVTEKETGYAIDPETGSILRAKNPGALFMISRVGFRASSDPEQVTAWLRAAITP